MNTARTSLFFMANLGAEVSRLLSFWEQHEQNAVRESHKRVEGIIMRLKDLPDMKGRKTELEILSHVLADFDKPKRMFSVSPENLRAYFRPFALRITAQ